MRQLRKPPPAFAQKLERAMRRVQSACAKRTGAPSRKAAASVAQQMVVELETLRAEYDCARVPRVEVAVLTDGLEARLWLGDAEVRCVSDAWVAMAWPLVDALQQLRQPPPAVTVRYVT